MQTSAHPRNKQNLPTRWTWGTWHLAVGDDASRQEITFDSAAGSEGWNLVGTFDLPQGAVTVELSDETDGDIVVADAIRWSPAAGTSPAAGVRNGKTR